MRVHVKVYKLCVCVCSQKSECIGKNFNATEHLFCIKTGKHVANNSMAHIFACVSWAQELQETQAGFPTGDKGGMRAIRAGCFNIH